MKPPGVGVHFTRVRMDTECTVANLARMEQALADAVATLMPGRDDLDVICYSCTSGSVVIGEERVIEELARARPGVKTTTLLTGVVAALRALAVRRIVVGTAYTDDINQHEREYLERQGFEVLGIEGLGLLTDQEMNRVTPEFLAAFAQEIDHPEADAIFLSCGALRSIDAIERVEWASGKPMVASNQASFWHCLRLAGIEDRLTGFGQLLREC
ncbi:MAG: arylmalonate decarboxylase [Gammaproteobacteria bacterium]|nr:arylmalonate decarboxylase [Gammaproteobacteria bacterium]NIR85019.1 arylmalonate decarboxylase [Gammaproteobacteria bacterium]NIR88286.1 arylmalonate decarboxylase [Gammaproteobacteria bacterium]NIU06066.1 arylmalonate decarboxylase [Gammaproteobacteria bacterium]NIV73485.1 arylmalonate decarboxylase [Gammaproteobacteria bacterium]